MIPWEKDQDCFADDVFFQDKTPVTGIVWGISVIAKHKIVVLFKYVITNNGVIYQPFHTIIYYAYMLKPLQYFLIEYNLVLIGFYFKFFTWYYKRSHII